MNIRKHWKKILLSSTAFFWASCGGDSEDPIYVTSDPNNASSTNPTINPDDLDGIKTDTLYGIRPVYNTDSGAISSSDACADCNAPASSSSEGTQYKLASDPTVTCTKGNLQPGDECLLYSTESESSTESDSSTKQSRQENADNLQNLLINNKTRTLEELSAIEDSLEKISPFLEEPLYGVPEIPRRACIRVEMQTPFECSNGQKYITHDKTEAYYWLEHRSLRQNDYIQVNGLLYSLDEYKENFVSSSSRAPESSSEAVSSSEPESSNEPESSSSVEPPSPLCTKDGFYINSQVRRTYYDNKEAIIDSVKTTLNEEELEAKKACLDSVRTKEIDFIGPIAAKQICDGNTIVNPRYQAKLDSNEAFVQQQIDECSNK